MKMLWSCVFLAVIIVVEVEAQTQAPDIENICLSVRCPRPPECPVGQVLVTLPGDCCPTLCGPDCSNVRCARPECPAGQVARVPEGSCCSVCECEVKGQEFQLCRTCPTTCIGIINEETQVCPAICQQGCGCPGDRPITDTTNGVCVTQNQCPNPCSELECPEGVGCRVREETGEGFCEGSCAVNNGGCRPDQECSLQQAPCLPDSPCPPPAVVCIDSCSQVECPVGVACTVREETGVSFCEGTCSVNNGGCRPDQECSVSIPLCLPDFPCPPPAVICTGTDPDLCEICEPDEVCFIEIDPCFAPPCPATPGCRKQRCGLDADPGSCRAAIPRYFFNSASRRCEEFTYGGCFGNENNFETLEECRRVCDDNSLSACASILCPVNSQCVVENGRASCQSVCSVNNGGCPPDTICRIQEVECLVTPCPAPIKICEDPCAGLECEAGSRCEVENGEGFCQPDCSLDNGGCEAGQTCRLEKVKCDCPPCPRERICEDSCPPECSREFCEGAFPSRVCSNPGPREIPECTGPCQLSYCGLCYVSVQEVSPPPGDGRCRTCSDLDDYAENTVCYRRWMYCTRRRHIWQFGRVDFDSPGELRCYNPTCPRRG